VRGRRAGDDVRRAVLRPVAVLCAGLVAAAPLALDPAGEAAAAPAAPGFETAAEGERWARVAAQVAARTAGWADAGERQLGNFIERRWCRPPISPADCRSGSFSRAPRQDHAVLRLSTLSTQPGGPRFGLSYQVLDLPAEGLGLSLSLVSGGRSVIGDQLQLQVLRAPLRPDAPPLLTLGDALRWPIADGAVEVPLPGAPDPLGAARLLRSSPDALRRAGGAQLLGLVEAVDRALAGGQLRRCVPGPYLGDGAPPECQPVPLSPDEQAAERARVRAVVDAQRAFLDAEAPAVHALLTAYLPG
jgi:hypothetical protein